MLRQPFGGLSTTAEEVVESLTRSPSGSMRVRCQQPSSSHDSDASSVQRASVDRNTNNYPRPRNPSMEGSSMESANDASEAFVMTHYTATPTLPRNVAHMTPSRRMTSRTYDAVAASKGSVSRPDYDDCLRRTAAVVHKHVQVCERRKARAQRRSSHSQPDDVAVAGFIGGGGGGGGGGAAPASAGAQEGASAAASAALAPFPASVSQMFEESRYISPQYAFACVRMPLAWAGFSYTMHKVKQSYAMPSMRDIYSFLSTLFIRAHLSSECSIVCLIYVERLMEKANVSLLRSTWRPIVLCSMLLASKVWQDCASWNVEFSVVFPQFSLAAINSLERNFVSALGWDMYISQSLYAKYYFALRSLNEKHDFRRRYNHFVMDTRNEQPRDAINVQMRSHKLRSEWSKALSKSL